MSDSNDPVKYPKRYLGDSVYASFDGWYIWLTTENGYPDDPRNKIALEPEVYQALINYHQTIFPEPKKDSE